MRLEERLLGERVEKCRIERLIGRGGHGLSFLAYDLELRERRVIKISQWEADDPRHGDQLLRAFLDEGMILSRLKHPQIVTLRAQGEVLGRRYMVLDYIEGHSLKSVLERLARRQAETGAAWSDLLPPATAAALVLSALRPLEYAHRANLHLPDREIFGVAHRDISPGNLILGRRGDERGKLTLIDFGTAKTELQDHLTRNHNLVGTIPYMGRARLQKASALERTGDPGPGSYWNAFRETQHDIHALGVLFFQLLTGRLPFAGESSPQIIVQILEAEAYRRCQAELADFHPGLRDILSKCIVYHDFDLPAEVQPYQYPEASPMLADLERLFPLLSPLQDADSLLRDLTATLDTEADREPPTASLEAMPGGHSSQPKTWVFELPGARVSGRSRALAALYPILVLAAGVAIWAWSRLHQRMPTLAPTIPALEPWDVHAQSLTADPRSKPPSGPPTPGHGAATARAATPIRPKPPTSPAPARTASATPLPTRSAITSATGATMDKGRFLQLQNQVRRGDPDAFESIQAMVDKFPEIRDLRFLKAMLIRQRNPESQAARDELAQLQDGVPTFLPPTLFRENVLYALWESDAAIYAQDPSPANRVRLLKSANAYVAAYGHNEPYAEKVRAVRASLGTETR